MTFESALCTIQKEVAWLSNAPWYFIIEWIYCKHSAAAALPQSQHQDYKQLSFFFPVCEFPLIRLSTIDKAMETYPRVRMIGNRILLETA